MPDIETVRTWEGRTLLDRDVSRIGTIDTIYLDDRTGQPEWALVNTGLFGTRSSFVPLAQAFQSDDDVLVPYDKQLVKDAPRVDADQHLSEVEERRLWRHYGLDYDTVDRSASGRDAASRARVGRDSSGPATDDAMTRSEEELRVGTAQRERGRVRLRKYVTTEHVEQVVPVRRERVRLEMSRSPTPTSTPPPPVRISPRPSTRSCCSRRSRWWRSGSCPGRGSGSTRTP